MTACRLSFCCMQGLLAPQQHKVSFPGLIKFTYYPCSIGQNSITIADRNSLPAPPRRLHEEVAELRARSPMNHRRSFGEAAELRRMAARFHAAQACIVVSLVSMADRGTKGYRFAGTSVAAACMHSWPEQAPTFTIAGWRLRLAHIFSDDHAQAGTMGAGGR